MGWDSPKVTQQVNRDLALDPTPFPLVGCLWIYWIRTGSWITLPGHWDAGAAEMSDSP